MDKFNQGLLAVVIAHNELEYVKLNTTILLDELKGTASEIVVVDNHSNDGLSEWLSAQNQISYMICDEQMEGYGQILEVVRNQFGSERDILLLRANYFFTPGSIALMSMALHDGGGYAAVGPVCNRFAGEQKAALGDTYAEAIRIQGTLPVQIVKTAYLDLDVMLIRAETIKYLTENVEIPKAVMRGYMRNVLRQGGCFAVAKQAVCFALCGTNDEPYRAFAPEIYRREQLHYLLYSFGDISYKGVYLYKYLEPEILSGINEKNKLQNTKRHGAFVIWNVLQRDDEVDLSTDAQAAQNREIIERLPERDVLFVTLPIRRMHRGAYVHTAMESFISSLDEDLYIDIECVSNENGAEDIPTKNRYAVLDTAIPKIYGVQSVDREELFSFIWNSFIHPLEEVLDLTFSDEVQRQCFLKASYILRQREAYMQFYRDVIARVKPKVVIYSHGQDTTLTYLRDATLELGIPTLEIAHGVRTFDTYHKNLVYADHLALYSEVEAALCREMGNDRVLGIGKPGVYDGIPKPQYKSPVIIVTFISSLENEIFSYAENLAGKLDKQKYQVVYKAHNSEVWSDEEKQKITETKNIQFLPGRFDIRETAELSDIVVGIRSSGIFDVLPYSTVKIIAVRDKAKNFSEAGPKEILQEAARSGEIIMAEDEQELYQEVLAYKRNVVYRQEKSGFWIADARERFRKLVDSYL